MDTLLFQDVFEPYYAGRKGFAAQTRKEPAKSAESRYQPVPNRSGLPAAEPSAKTDVAREH